MHFGRVASEHSFSRWFPGRQQSGASKLQASLKPASMSTSKLYSIDAASSATAVQNASVTGKWKKIASRSDDMKEACDIVELSWLLRKALRLLDTLEVNNSPERFETKIKAGGIMDVVERYSWSGDITEHKRRDKRRGIHRGRVSLTESGPQISVEWDDPFGGRCLDTFQVSDDNQTLTQLTEMTMQSGKTCMYRTVEPMERER
ncbi:hypothetical protein WJX84_002777 [Apatococcus fuscideae]|uniref:Uncharacterized protein n=1 Tax=Apatococcus fuscideae TaxID=2026836 RepID=A0AAW1T182_9CHLO